MELAEQPNAAPAGFRDSREKWYSPYRGVPAATTLRWLVTGVLVYALLLLVAVSSRPEDATLLPFLGPSFYLTPAFGLPFVLATAHRPGRLRRIVYFIVLLPLVHMAAVYVAWDHGLSRYAFEPGAETLHLIKSGAFGGVVGATLAFALLWLVGLAPGTRPRVATMGLATAALTAIGAASMAQAGLLAGGAAIAAHDSSALIIGLELIHAPWQLAFAFALATLMRPFRPRSRFAARGAA